MYRVNKYIEIWINIPIHLYKLIIIQTSLLWERSTGKLLFSFEGAYWAMIEASCFAAIEDGFSAMERALNTVIENTFELFVNCFF